VELSGYHVAGSQPLHLIYALLAGLDSARVEWVEQPVLTGHRISVKARVFVPGLDADDVQADVLVGKAANAHANPFDWQGVTVQPLLLVPESEQVFMATADLDAFSHGSTRNSTVRRRPISLHAVWALLLANMSYNAELRSAAWRRSFSRRCAAWKDSRNPLF